MLWQCARANWAAVERLSPQAAFLLGCALAPRNLRWPPLFDCPRPHIQYWVAIFSALTAAAAFDDVGTFGFNSTQ